SGRRWHFQSHQFRHTVGTRMINNNVPHHIIQRYLGHASPTMTQVYAYLHDTTLKKEIAKFHEKVVNICGKVIESVNPEIDNNTDLQWMSRKVLGEVLPHGYCGLPVQFTCSKGNACLTCSDFRTTREFLEQHKEHRERLLKLLETAKANNWQRQIQVNEGILQSLDNIIKALEKNNG
ncbi:MAG: tyrosine-type recombinase/integrase, partial [Microcystaceae cyanobacterium]